MVNRKLYISLTKVFKRLAVLVFSVALLFGVSQPTALASSAPGSLVALAASSRFAAQAESDALKPVIPEERLSEMREQRREWQNQVSASASAAADNAKNKDQSAGELVKDKLNLDEITQENEIVDELTPSRGNKR
ncbi:hypothetical protein PGN35_002530 [Nodosilinea sp. PGN35]|uniref:hypothetical protein n=1 Tax=Nodosilinea sp. PGN35 TaxID=3020489 RepID=UPI0023B23E16|nr:hypothetical protein [Nodosilinea sp. TSF1-S3]MDF0365495.1 hypothetical protein [Nodosilinea sp. TSF1-S3]